MAESPPPPPPTPPSLPPGYSYSSAANPVLLEKLDNYLEDADNILVRLELFEKHHLAQLLKKDMDRVRDIALSAQLEFELQMAYFDLRLFNKALEEARLEFRIEVLTEDLKEMLARLKSYNSPLVAQLEEASANGIVEGLKTMADYLAANRFLQPFRQELRRLNGLNADSLVDPITEMLDKM